MVSARQVHLPHYLCPAHASTLLSPAPSAPYGNDLLLPDLADMHGSPSAYATSASVSFVLGFINAARAQYIQFTSALNTIEMLLHTIASLAAQENEKFHFSSVLQIIIKNSSKRV